jgi:hypothetical protein
MRAAPDADIYSKASSRYALIVIMEKADSTLATQGWVGDKPYIVTIDANQERMNASLREEIKSGQAEMRPTVRAIEEKMEAAVHSLRACRKEVVACQETMAVHLECKEPT